MKNDGKKSEKLFEDHWKAKGKKVYVHRFVDTKQIKGRQNGQGFSQAAPSDYLITNAGHMFYAEVKSCSDKISFSFSQFTPSQNACMVRQCAAHGVYMIYIHNLNTDEWFQVNAVEILDRKMLGVKSMKWTEMQRWMI